MALELVGGALLSSFLQVAFEKLASPQVLNFFGGRKLDETLLNELKANLLSIGALADDAEQKQFQDQRVRAWLAIVNEAVLDAEDVLDEIYYELSKWEVEAQSESQTCTCKVPNFFDSSFRSFNWEIDSRIKQILKRLKFLSDKQDALGLKNASSDGVGSGSKVSQKLQSTSSVVESVIYGRDGDKKMIFNWLTSDTDNCNQLSILSIVGMGGLGKTTLAQHVYNDPRIEGKFDIKAWVCVSDDFDVLKVTRTILERITKSTDDSRDLEMVHQRLKEKLSGKKFFLVLDDVWNEERGKWEVVQAPLINCGTQGSKILVTTRSKEVASTMRSKEHHLEQLQPHDCWELFAKHAFQADNPQPNEDLREIGLKVVDKCKRLPLALKTMGSLLHNKSSISEWRSVLQSEIWEFLKDRNDIVPALALSYQHLPSHLKRCFAYCALFPKDYLFDKEYLIQLWMAENFLQFPHQSKNPEEVGEQYFNDLLSRSFFQQSSIGSKSCFVMHDLLNDLAKYVCGDMYFMFEVDKGNKIPQTTRHLSVAINHVLYFDWFRSSHDTKRLRTFMPTSENKNFLYDRWYCKTSIHKLFSEFKSLRVLSLSDCSNLTDVPDSVGNLKHLRSLDFSNTDIEKLPETTCSLYNLQILKLNNCTNLKELPSNLHNLTHLRCLELLETEVRKMPVHLGKLKNLQVLMSSFDVGKSSEFSIQQLGKLNLHGSLSIRELQNIENPSDALVVGLKNKTQLEELKLEWDLVENRDDSAKERDAIIIENLQPFKHLEKLSIINYDGTRFPSWLVDNSLSNMVSLVLKDCKCCPFLPPLGLLPSLKDLKITELNGIVAIDADFYGNSSSSFRSLETLKFSHMKKWEKWECQAVKSSFPCLQHLCIEKCPKLKGTFPEQLLQLKILDIRDCQQLVSSIPMAPEISELTLWDSRNVQFDYHPTNLKELSISGYYMGPSLMERIEHIISHTSLERLFIYYYRNMNIPMSRHNDFLVRLKISNGCDSLKTFPLDFFPKLSQLDLKNCRSLQEISQGHCHNHLKSLSISKCLEFQSLPESMHILLPSLRRLKIKDCPNVESFPEESLPSNLKEMDICNCSKLVTSLKGALGANPLLETLHIGKLDVASFPDEGLLPLSLKSLEIYDFPDLEKLDNNGLCQLSSLMELVLKNCPKLPCLPEEGLPNSISDFKISGDCSLLRQRCQDPKGDWGKIAHIEYLNFRYGES